MAVKITMTTNSAQTVKELDKVDKKIQKIQKENSIRQGVAKLNKDLDGLVGGTKFGQEVLGFTNKLGGLTRLLNPWTAAITAAIAATTYFNKMINDRVNAGMETANAREKAVATLAGQLSTQGVVDPQGVVEQLEIMSENGVATVEELTKAFSRLVPVMKGNTKQALEWTQRMHDVQAATGISAEQLTGAINQILTTGNIEEKLAKKIPFWQSLSEVMNQSIEDVKKLAQAHKIGSEEMIEAMRKATEIYAGTSQALSSTTEGSKASMEAAKGRAYAPYAEGRNRVMREYYQRRQHDYDQMALDEAIQANTMVLGEISGKLDELMARASDLMQDIGDAVLMGIAEGLENALGINFKSSAVAGRNRERDKNLSRIQESKNRPSATGDPEVTKNIIAGLQSEIESINQSKVLLNKEAMALQKEIHDGIEYPLLKKLLDKSVDLDKAAGIDSPWSQALADDFYEFLTEGFLSVPDSMEHGFLRLPVGPMQGPAALNDLIKYYTNFDFAAFAGLKKNVDGMNQQLEDLLASLKQADVTMQEFYRAVSVLTEIQHIQEAVKQKREELEGEFKQNREWGERARGTKDIHDKVVMEGKDRDAIAKQFGQESADELISYFEAIEKGAKRGVLLTKEEIEAYGKLEKPYRLLIKLREEERAALERETAEKRKQYEAQAAQREEFERAYFRTSDYDKAYDHLMDLQGKLGDAAMSAEDRGKIHKIEVDKMLQDAMKTVVTKQSETISAGGIRSLKDFQFDSINFNEKQLQVTEDIKQAAEDVYTTLTAIREILPSPTMAQ